MDTVRIPGVPVVPQPLPRESGYSLGLAFFCSLMGLPLLVWLPPLAVGRMKQAVRRVHWSHTNYHHPNYEPKETGPPRMQKRHIPRN